MAIKPLVPPANVPLPSWYTSNTQKLLRQMTRRIVAAFQPEQVILFGSFAYGEPRSHSDVDLLVVTNRMRGKSVFERDRRVAEVAHDIEEKLRKKHHVTRQEVEQVFDTGRFRFAEKGHVHGEDLYRAIGQTESGRYLVVFFIYKYDQSALVISARDLTEKERKEYAKK